MSRLKLQGPQRAWKKILLRGCVLLFLLYGVALLIWSREPPTPTFIRSGALHPTHLKPKRIVFYGTYYGESGLSKYCIYDKESLSFCPYPCEYSADQSNDSVVVADAVVIHGRESGSISLPPLRNPNQIWVFTMFESPQNSWTDLSSLNHIFNWTMSHRLDSDVVLSYGTLYARPREAAHPTPPYNASFLLGRRGISWAASNCGCVANDRALLVDELSKTVQVDRYGACGNLSCPSRPLTSWWCEYPQLCAQYLGARYKFYLAFENSNCEDYITEKVFNALRYDMVPVVYGPSRDSYERVLPPNAFIHVSDFPTVAALGQYLAHLENHEEEYLQYFQWKMDFTVDEKTIYHRGWCRLCTKLHQEEMEGRMYRGQSQSYPSIYNWWFFVSGRGDGGQQQHPRASCNLQTVRNGTIVISQGDYSRGVKHC